MVESIVKLPLRVLILTFTFCLAAAATVLIPAVAQKQPGDTINSIKSKAKKAPAKRNSAGLKKSSAISKSTPKRSAKRAKPAVAPKQTTTRAQQKPPNPTEKPKAAAAIKPPDFDITRGLLGWWRCEGNPIDVTVRHSGTITGSVSEIPGAV